MPEGVSSPQVSHPFYDAGKTAYIEGMALDACPYGESYPHERSDWISGWMFANKTDPLLDDDEREPDSR